MTNDPLQFPSDRELLLPAPPRSTDINVGWKDGKVILQFSAAIENLMLDPRTARKLAESIRKASYQAVE